MTQTERKIARISLMSNFIKDKTLLRIVVGMS